MIRRPPRSTLFPYRRSSDLDVDELAVVARLERSEDRRQRDVGDDEGTGDPQGPVRRAALLESEGQDRKSTRLNSSHSQISYAVFCLKKKKTQINKQQ